MKPEAKVRKLLKLQKEELALQIIRLRKCDGVAVMLEETYLPTKYGFVMEEDLTGSICAMLRSHGAEIVHATKTVEICYATDRETQLLDVRSRQPLLLHYDISMNEDWEEVLCSKLVSNSERYTLTITM